MRTLPGSSLIAGPPMRGEIDRYVAEAANLYSTRFADLMFLEPDSQSLKVLVRMRVLAMRLSLPTRSFLHIHSVRLLGDDGEPIPIRVKGLSASSTHGKASVDQAKCQIVDHDGSHDVAVHTGNDLGPWIELLLEAPVDACWLLVKNRGGPYAKRAAGLKVSVSESGSDWVEVHDDSSLAAELALEVEKIRNRWSPVDEALAAASGVVSAVLASRYDRIDRFMHSALLTAAELAEIRRSVNERILFARGLEWTSHGVRRSFRFWKESELVDYVALTAEVCSDLLKLTPDVCLGFGSVLSIVRDGELMKHDDDLDIIVAFDRSTASSFRVALDRVKSHLEGFGYEVRGNFFSHWHVLRRGRKVDVFVGIYEDNEKIGWFPGSRGVLAKEDVFPSRSVVFMGTPCAIPRDPEGYLLAVYGPSWRSPLPGWKHDWDRSAYLDLA